MLRIKTILNLMIFTIVVGGTVFGFRWYDGYKAIKKEDTAITFKEYVKSDLTEMKDSLKEIPTMMKEVAVSSGNMQKSYVDKMANVVEMYAMDYGEYPRDLSELVGEYLDEKALSQEGFYYQKMWGGYEMGIELKNGETYTVTNK